MTKGKRGASGGRPVRRDRPRLDVELGAVDAGEDVVIRMTSDLADAVVLPRSVARLGEEQMVTLKAVQRNVLQTQILTQQLDYLVDQARDEGVSWAAIGWSVGTTGEAARQRWGDFDAAAQPR